MANNIIMGNKIVINANEYYYSNPTKILSFRYHVEALADCDFILEVLWSKSLQASYAMGLKKLWTVNI